MIPSVYLTHHGVVRARQRCGWAGATLQRMMSRIVNFGATPADCPAPIRAWLFSLLARHPERRCRIYGNHVFIFHSGAGEALILVTILHLPQELIKLWRRHGPSVRPSPPAAAEHINVQRTAQTFAEEPELCAA